MRIAKRADGPIYCYKILFFDEERNLFVSPVTKTVYSCDGRMHAEGFSTVLPEPRKGMWANVIYGFHSYMSMDDIRVYGQTVDNLGTLNIIYGSTDAVVAKCVIPRGAMYWEGNGRGEGSDVYDQYCSDSIELVALLDPETGGWRRPGRPAGKQEVNILIGLDIAEARERLGRWYVLESQEVDCNSGVYRFDGAGTYGRVELRTSHNKVVSVD